jgi:hypothetical protein
MMKRVLGITVILMIVLNSFGQAGIRVFTRLDEAKFKISLDGVLENQIQIKEIMFDSLNHKKPHEIVISFGVDSIADIEMDVYLLKDQVREFQIMRKSEIVKKTAKIGRKIGKVLKIGNHDKEGKLYDVYYLEEQTKSQFMNN